MTGATAFSGGAISKAVGVEKATNPPGKDQTRTAALIVLKATTKYSVKIRSSFSLLCAVYQKNTGFILLKNKISSLNREKALPNG